MTLRQDPAAPAADAPLSIVINAGSGHGDASEAERTIAGVLGEAGRRHAFLRVADPARLDGAVADAVRAAQADAGIVVAVGGDGTLSAVARGALAAGVPFAALPQGTFNLFGRDHGIPQDLVAATRALLRARIAPVQVGRVNGRAFLVNASLGLYPELLENREEAKQRHGRSRLVAYWSGLLTLLRERPRLQLEIDGAGGPRSTCTTTLFVGNNRLQLDRVGIGDPDPGRDDTLTAVIVRPRGWLAMLWLALRGALGRLGDAGNVDSFEFRRITVTPQGLRRCKVALDGEIEWLDAPLRFDVAPQPLRLLLPAPADRAEIA